MKKALYIITIILLLVVFGFSAFYVVNYLVESKTQADKFNELAEVVAQAKADKETQPQNAPADATESTEPDDGTPKMLSEYAALYAMNNDLVGWIKIEGTEIDYPVMQTPDETDYYLRRNFYGEYSTAGCIYAREACDVFEPSDNVTLYGHKMHDGSMFAVLHDYKDKEVWENNSLIFYDTLYEYHVYKIFSVFVTTASVGEGFSYHKMVDAEDEADFDKFIATCKDLALYDTGVTPVYGDKVICLSTCDYGLENGRLVVAAVRIS